MPLPLNLLLHTFLTPPSSVANSIPDVVAVSLGCWLSGPGGPLSTQGGRSMILWLDHETGSLVGTGSPSPHSRGPPPFLSVLLLAGGFVAPALLSTGVPVGQAGVWGRALLGGPGSSLGLWWGGLRILAWWWAACLGLGRSTTDWTLGGAHNHGWRAILLAGLGLAFSMPLFLPAF